MDKKNYIVFRKIFMTLPEDVAIDLAAPKTKTDLEKTRVIQKRMYDFIQIHGDPVIHLRKNQDDMAIYTPLFFAAGGYTP